METQQELHIATRKKVEKMNLRTILTQQRTQDVCENSKIQHKYKTELKITKF